jgi:hypothetical protein
MGRFMRRNLLVSLSFMALAGCATEPSLQSRMAAYIGASEQTLVQQLGVPDKQITVNGVQYVAYNWRRQEAYTRAYGGYGPWVGPYYGGFFPSVYEAGLSPQIVIYSCETTFTLQNGKVASFILRGNDCY